MSQLIRTYRIPSQEIPDFEAEIMHRLVKAPASYRPNSAGMYTVLKNAAIIWVRKYQKWAHTEESGSLPEFYTAEHDHFADVTDWQQKLENRRLAEQLLRAMQTIPEPERICLSFHYGITPPRPLSHFLIARKLGMSEDWVKRRLERGKFLLRKRLNGDSLRVRTNHA